MKKFIYATLALAAVLLFASCKNDKNQPKNEAGDAYVSFTFNLPDEGLRANAADVAGANHGDFYKGTDKEQAIKNVRVVLYDPTSGQVKYSLDYSISATGGNPATGEISGTATAAKFTTKGKEVVKQAYQMLAIINPTSKISAATEVGKSITDAMLAIESNPEELSQNGESIVMTNDRGLVEVKATQLKENQGAAEGAPVSVSVDRILAKVFVNQDAQMKLPKGVTFTNVKWQLNTTNKKTFIFRQFGKVVTTMDNFVDETATDASTRINRYAKDPNYQGFVAADFNSFTGDNTLTLKNDLTFASDKGEYCLENTMDADQQKHNQTTSFILRGTWKPADHDGMTFTATATWYSYKGGFTITTAKMKEYVAIVKDGTKDAIIDIPYTPAGFKAALKKAVVTDQVLKIDNNGDVEKSGVFGDIKAYKDGICFYQTNLIRHFTNSQSSKEMGYGRYGVVRNNIYKVNIKEITRPGEPTVVPEDNGNDDPTKVFIAFDITINPWIVRTQDISL